MITDYEITNLSEGPTHYYSDLEETIAGLREILSDLPEIENEYEISIIVRKTGTNR